MSFQEKIRPLVMAVRRRPVLWNAVQSKPVRRVLGPLPGFRSFYLVSGRLHPFDLAHGTDTGGYVPSDELPASDLTTDTTHFYWGAPPSIVRKGLAVLPSPETFTFIDLGCGKGRPLLIASEFPFRAILGADISPALVAIAEKNADIIARHFPTRTKIVAEACDAGKFAFPAGNIVLFLYNPFGENIMKRVAAALEAALDAEPRQVFVAYFNPVYGACWDASARFQRYHAAQIAYSAEELGFGPRVDDALIIWQSGSVLAPMPHANARIVITEAGHRAEVV